MDIEDYIKKYHKYPIIEEEIEMSEDDRALVWNNLTRAHKCKDIEMRAFEQDYEKLPSIGEVTANTAFRGPQGQKGSFNGINFDSVWEYAYYRYMTEIKGEWVERNRTESLDYFVDSYIHQFYPDFKTVTGYVEIKGILRAKDQEKMSQHPEVTFLFGPDIKPMIEELNKQIPNWRKDYTNRT